MKVISVYAPIPPSSNRTHAGNIIASNSRSLISSLCESGCELILHDNSGQAYFSVPDGFEHPSIINVADDWRIATFLYENTGVQHTKYRIVTISPKMRYAGVNIMFSKTEFDCLEFCFDEYSTTFVHREKMLNTMDLSMYRRGNTTVYDMIGNIVISIAGQNA